MDPVPANRHPELAGRNAKETEAIVRGGQMLMEQPKEYEKESHVTWRTSRRRTPWKNRFNALGSRLGAMARAVLDVPSTPSQARSWSRWFPLKNIKISDCTGLRYKIGHPYRIGAWKYGSGAKKTVLKRGGLHSTIRSFLMESPISEKFLKQSISYDYPVKRWLENYRRGRSCALKRSRC